MVKTLACAVFYSPALYQGIDAKNPLYLQEIIHIMAFLNESVCGSSTGDLLRSNTEAFRVEMGIPFSITGTEYDDKTFAYYMPDGWYKSLWKFTSKTCYKMDITEDYEDLPLLRSKDVYLMQAFVDHGYKEKDLK